MAYAPTVFGTPSGFDFLVDEPDRYAEAIRKFDSLGFPPVSMPLLGESWVFFKRTLADAREVCGIGLLVRVYEATENRSGCYCGVGYLFSATSAVAAEVVAALREFSANARRTAIEPTTTRFLAPKFSEMKLIARPIKAPQEMELEIDSLTQSEIHGKKWLVECKAGELEKAIQTLLDRQAYLSGDCLAFLTESSEATNGFRDKKDLERIVPTKLIHSIESWVKEIRGRALQRIQEELRRREEAERELERKRQAQEQQRAKEIEAKLRQERALAAQKEAQRHPPFKPPFPPIGGFQSGGGHNIPKPVSAQELQATERKLSYEIANLRFALQDRDENQGWQNHWLTYAGVAILCAVIIVFYVLSIYYLNSDLKEQSTKTREVENTLTSVKEDQRRLREQLEELIRIPAIDKGAPRLQQPISPPANPSRPSPSKGSTAKTIPDKGVAADRRAVEN